MNSNDINGEVIARADFKDKEFESFLRELLDHEIGERHAATAHVLGPVERYHGDAQRDLVVVVEREPKQARVAYPYPLTWDDPGETWYSCKGGPRWPDAVKDELGRAAYNAYLKQGREPSTRVRQQPSRVLLEHIAGGGRYVFVVSQQIIDERSFRTYVCELITFWLERAKLSVPDSLGDQFSLIDANWLASFIKRRKGLILSKRIQKILDMTEPESVASVEEWQREMAPGRALPTFESDAERDRVISALGSGTEFRITRVYGPPGVGKTRAVYEALARRSAADLRRVRYSSDPDALLGNLRDWLPRAGKVILVVDEVRSLDVRDLINRFGAHADSESQLVLIGTSDAEAGREYEGVELLPLTTLSSEATRSIVEAEFHKAGVAPDERIVSILALAEGYPLFALKLAEALVRDGDALDSGDDDTNAWDAAQRVLVGPRAGVPDWAAEADRRGRCLLVVILTEGLRAIDWDELWGQHGAELAQAVDADADQLRRAARDCIAREILREISGRRYVSPANLARILINHYLSGPPGEDLGPRILRYTPKFATTLVQVARQVKVKPELLRRFASRAWEEFIVLAQSNDVTGLKSFVWGRAAWASEEDPVGAVRALTTLSNQLITELLDSASQSLAGALAHITRRKVDFAAFHAAERMLFRVARIDQSRHSFVRDRWASLWLVAMSTTHQPWLLRFELFQNHARSSDVNERVMAAETLERLLGREDIGPIYFEPDTRDGRWPTMSAAQFSEGKGQLWDLALDLGADPSIEVAKLSRAAIVKRLREGIGVRPRHVERLTDSVGQWTPEQRQQLSEAVYHARRAHQDSLERWPEMADALERLEGALQPRDVLSRLVARVATWQPEPWDASDRRRNLEVAAEHDRSLALELLADPSVMSEALLWLSSKAALRAWYFMIALGQVDADQSILSRLEAHARATTDERLLAAYVVGWGRVDAEGADAWIGANSRNELMCIAATALAWSNPSTHRFILLTELVRGGAARPDIIRSFVEHHWIVSSDPEQAVALLQMLHDTRRVPVEGLEMSLHLLDGVRLNDGLRRRTLGLLEGFLVQTTSERVPMVAQWPWVQAAKLLARIGRVEVVVEQLIVLLRVETRSLELAEQGVSELLADGFGSALWRGLRDSLLGPEGEGFAYHLAHVDLLGYLDGAEVLDWVGEAPERGRAVAMLVNPYNERLSIVAETMLERFGSEGAVAEQLRDRVLSSPVAVVGGTSAFERCQLEHAKTWSTSRIPAVRVWAEKLVDELTQRVDESEARLQFARKYA